MVHFPSMRSRRLVVYPVCALALSIASFTYAGPTWDSDAHGEAGDSAATAQVVTQTGTVLEIKGRLNASAFLGQADYADMFLVQITSPMMLKISTADGDSGGYAQFNSSMFLFEADGVTGAPRALGLLGNSDFSQSSNGSFLVAQSNDGSGFVLTEPGFYYIAISLAGVNPLSGTQLIWPELSPGVIAFGNGSAQTGWTMDPSTLGGDYSIRLTGVEGVPAPGALALLLLAPLARRRQR